MITIDIKPLSVNAAWQGRRYKSNAYKKYCYDVPKLLPKNIKLPKGNYIAVYEFGLSNLASDWDNPVKPIQDIISQKYKFDDRNIIIGITHKVKVPKGKEYIRFHFYEYRVETFEKIITLLNTFNT